MSPLRDDGRGSTATAVAVACVALAVLVPAVTAAAHVPVSSESIDSPPGSVAGDGPSVSCTQGTTSIGAASDVRERSHTVRSQSAAASAGEETVPLGGIAFVSLSVADGLNSTVEIGSGTNHTVEGTVRDDGDGRATLRINTYAAANGAAVGAEAYSVTGADELTIQSGETDAPMTNRTYSIGVYRDDAVVDEARLNVTAPDFGTVTALSGPPQLHDAGTVDAVRTAEALGMLSNEQTEYNRTAVRLGETVVLRIESPSFLGAVAAQPGETATERLGRVHEYHDRDPSVAFGIDGPCYALDYEASADNGAVRALPDYANGTLYLLVDHDRTEQYTGYGSFGLDVDDPNPLGNYDEYLHFERGEYGDTDRRPTVDRLGPYSYDQRVDGVVSWPTDGSVEISGETELSSITLGYQSLTEPNYRVSRTVEVRDETFATELPLPDADRGLFEITVGNTSYTAKVGDVPNATWELAPPDGADRVDRIGIEQLKLEDGGFIVAYRPTQNASTFNRVGSAGADDVAMSIASTNESQHLIVVAHRDGNDNGRFDGPKTDPAYRVGGNAVREWVAVETTNGALSDEPPLGSFALSKVGDPDPNVPPQTTTAPPTPVTATPRATPSPAPTATPEPTEAESPEPTSTDTTTAVGPSPTAGGTDPDTPTASTPAPAGTAAGGPGFDTASALVGLAAAWFVRARRRA
ncbi:DUF7282 domain-containing protein [Halosimplex amylolyticum]|uniref:DUF7282 domain-containing protein n=1 Tax=Halosimplex amylolyticum TaxID=3396616 RepID=UPI003F57F272